MKRPSQASRADATRAKHERLAINLGREAFVTKSGIQSLLRNVRDEGLPEAFSRRSQYRARKAIAGTQTIYGPLIENETIQLTKNRELALGYQNPQAWLYYQAKHSEHFAKVVEEAWQLYPATPQFPWLIVLYQDGVDPSDGLSINHSRSSNVFYWSFLQFGTNALAHEECWGTITMLRKPDATNIANGGGLAYILDRVVNRFLRTRTTFAKLELTWSCMAAVR